MSGSKMYALCRRLVSRNDGVRRGPGIRVPVGLLTTEDTGDEAVTLALVTPPSAAVAGTEELGHFDELGQGLWRVEQILASRGLVGFLVLRVAEDVLAIEHGLIVVVDNERVGLAGPGILALDAVRDIVPRQERILSVPVDERLQGNGIIQVYEVRHPGVSQEQDIEVSTAGLGRLLGAREEVWSRDLDHLDGSAVLV